MAVLIETITDTNPDSPTFGQKTVIEHTVPDPEPRVFDGADWREYAYGVLGAIAAPQGTAEQQLAAGMVRYGAILKAARASSDDGVIAALDQYDRASNFRKDKVAIFLGFLNADNQIVSTAEMTAIAAHWPA